MCFLCTNVVVDLMVYSSVLDLQMLQQSHLKKLRNTSLVQ